jgi:hypothetical protein
MIAPESRTYRGTISGLEGANVAASLTESGQLLASIMLEDDTMWEITPLSRVVDHADVDEYVVFDSGQIDLPDYRCGVEDQGDGQHVHPKYGGGETDALKFAEIGIDADYEFYQKNGSSINATIADVEDIMNGVDTIYRRDCEIAYTITTIIVRSSEPDPYSSTNPETLLGQFQNHWNSSQGGVKRDVAHLFTGKNLSGSVIGIAYLSVICNTGSAYGLSESRYTTSRNPRVGLTCHELGHNWSAGHCDGNGDCRIMCSGIGGCNRDVTKFGVPSKNKIINYKNSRTCLDDEPIFRLEIVPPPPMNGGSSVDFRVLSGTPSLQTALFYSLKGEGLTQVAPGIYVDLKQPKMIGIKVADGNGDAIWPVSLPNINVRVFLQGVQSNADTTNIAWGDIE